MSFEEELFWIGWVAEVREKTHRKAYASERDAEQWIDHGGESG